jgi:hypothetical protein
MPPRFHKLTFPTYDGKEDPLGWLNRCEQFFRAQMTRPTDQVWYASYHLTGVAQQWYLVLERTAGRPDWATFRELCHQRFGPPMTTNHLAALARLPFTSTVDAYAEAFQARMAHAGNLEAVQQARLFTGGLPDHIRVDVELHEPQDLHRAVRLARAFEIRNAPPQSPVALHRPVRRQLATLPAPTSTTSTPSASTPPRPFKRLSPAEMTERRKLGLCYNCDEPYVKGHKCPHLFYLEVTDYTVEEPADDDRPPPAPAAFDPDEPLISLHAITGIRTEETMQLYVSIGNEQFIALLDSGSTSNFVSLDVAHRTKLAFDHCPSSGVVVANGDRVACRGYARDVAIRITDEFFDINCYTIPLGTYDMVLGVSFLRKLGPILWNFDDLCMAF